MAAAAPAGDTISGIEGGEGIQFGALEVLCGDYTQLAGSLRQDIVFMDPPWGGPQYRGMPAAAGAAPALVGGGAGSAAVLPPAAPRASGAEAGAMYGDTAFTLGGRPLSYMVSELLMSGAAGMVALKLPSRGDAELRAMQARVRQLVSAELAAGAGAWRGCCGGGQGDGGDGDADCPEANISSCCPRLLGAEVTLGRTSMVVFILVPYKQACRTVHRDAGIPEGGAQGAEGARVRHAAAGVGPKGREGEGGGQSGGGDVGESERGDAVDNCGGGGANSEPRGRAGGLGPAAAHPSECPACVGLGLAFRAALKERCMREGLPYRLVCE